MPKPTRFSIAIARDEMRLNIDEHFWDDTIVSEKDGTTQLDFNIATVLQEIRAALYYVATDGTKH
jgi:hypothetical protein